MKYETSAIPSPAEETRKISTNDLLLLKYCPTINEAGSRVIPMPTPASGNKNS